MTARDPDSGAGLGRGSAFAKAILLGEHAVVHGSPAIALGFGSGARAEARWGAPRLRLGPREASPGDASAEWQGYCALVESLAVPRVPAAQVDLDVPAGVGLGGSAAVGVALARAVASLAAGSPPLPPARLLEAAAAWERVFHGNPSGVDAAAAFHGGAIWFSKAGGAESIGLVPPFGLVLCRASAAPSTREMVERVARARRTRPSAVDKILDTIAALVQAARAPLQSGDVAAVGELLNRNHQLLSELGVSSTSLDRAVDVALRSGAAGAKLTGAGGGGCVLAVTTPERLPALEQAMRVAGGWVHAQVFSAVSVA